MTTIRATQATLPVILTAIAGELTDWRREWSEFEAEPLPAAQYDWARNEKWGGRPLFGGGFNLSAETVRKRREREDYYENAPTGGATLETELFWTGAMSRASAKMTRKGVRLAEIDTEQSYDGPIPRDDFTDPVEQIVVGIHEGEIWPLERLDRLLDDVAESKAQSAIDEVARRVIA